MTMDFHNISFDDFFNIELALENLPFILGGVPIMLFITIGSMGFGMILGLILALWRSSKHIYLRWPARVYISFMRGTPMLVFLFILYFGLPMTGLKLSALTA